MKKEFNGKISDDDTSIGKPKCRECNDTGIIEYKPIEYAMYSWDPWLTRKCNCKSINKNNDNKV